MRTAVLLLFFRLGFKIFSPYFKCKLISFIPLEEADFSLVFSHTKPDLFICITVTGLSEKQTLLLFLTLSDILHGRMCRSCSDA